MADQEQNSFTQRSDNAAAQLKAAMNLPESKVTVDANGQPPAPPPPDGSYARANYDEAVAAQARIQQAEAEAEARQLPADGPRVAETPRELTEDQLSDKASERIQDLVSKLREKDQAVQQLQASNQQSETQIAELKQMAEQLKQQHDQFMAKQLEDLDPEERARILGDLHVQQAVQAAEQRIMQQLQPALSSIGETVLAREYEAVAAKYPQGFDPRVHPELIKQFREMNPNCSVELAFRAVATNEELGLGENRAAPRVPPTLAPTHTGVPKSVPTQHVSQPSNPAEEVAQEAQQAFALLRDPAAVSQRTGMRALDNVIAKRLFGAQG